MNSSISNRIEKQILLKASQERVWQAISNAEQFEKWSGMQFESPFAEDTLIKARLFAAAAPEHNGAPVEWHIERIEPMRFFSLRWHPFPVEPKVDYSKEPLNLVTFTLEPADGGTLLTIVESGFDRIPPERRADAFEGNEKGWEMQLQNLEKYLAQNQRVK